MFNMISGSISTRKNAGKTFAIRRIVLLTFRSVSNSGTGGNVDKLYKATKNQFL